MLRIYTAPYKTLMVQYFIIRQFALNCFIDVSVGHVFYVATAELAIATLTRA